MRSLSGEIAERRIIVPVAVLGADPELMRQEVANALLDTGATASGVSSPLVAALQLKPYQRKPLIVATEQRIVNYFALRIGIFCDQDEHASGPMPYIFDEISGFEISSNDAFDVILGMDVLSQTDFSMFRGGRWTLSFG